MTLVPKLAGAALLLACAACTTTTGVPVRTYADGEPLRGSDCLDPQFVRSWTRLDDRTLLVDAGRFKYLLELPPACVVAWSPVLLFRGTPISGRVCGGAGDAIITRDRTCGIERMRMLGADEYKAILQARDEARRRARGTD